MKTTAHVCVIIGSMNDFLCSAFPAWIQNVPGAIWTENLHMHAPALQYKKDTNNSLNYMNLRIQYGS